MPQNYVVQKTFSKVLIYDNGFDFSYQKVIFNYINLYTIIVKMGEGVCEYCWDIFKIKYKGQRFCSKRCVNNSHTKNWWLICERCWRKFKWKWRKQKYCSQKCKWLAHRRKNIICLQCGKEFYPSYSTQRYCCQECGNKSRIVNLEKRCLVCNKTFLWSSKTQRYCSVLCAWVAAKKHKTKACPICWELFYSNHPNAKYCSRKCSWIAHRTLKEKECPICWIKFRPYDAWRVYCSVECWHKGQSKTSSENRAKLSSREKEKRMEHLFNTCDTDESVPNAELNEFLILAGYTFIREFKLGGYSFDFKIWDILIENNPFAFHNSTRAPNRKKAKPKTPDYHYNKAKCAVNHWYKIVEFWVDWMTGDTLLYILQNLKQTIINNPILHWYNPKKKEHLVDDWYDKDEMLKKWYVEIYDAWEQYIFNSTNLN